MARYGQVHRIVDFVARTIPKRGHGRFDDLFAHQIIEFLKELDATQEANQWLTFNFQTGDGIWTFYKGQLAFLFLPAQKHVRLTAGRDWPSPARTLLTSFIRSAGTRHFSGELHTPTHWQWRLDSDELLLIIDFLRQLDKGSIKSALAAKDHPRMFSGEVRQAALDLFIRGGSWCPGIIGRKKHRLNLSAGDRVEFDHILPHAKGGTSGEMNIQVLCSECNNAKRARAI